MKYQVFVTDAAFAEADQHVHFLSQVSPDAAIKLAEEFSKIGQDLADLPFSYTVIPFPGKGEYRRLVIQGRYAVVFKIQGNNVFVETIVDCRSKYSWLMLDY